MHQLRLVHLTDDGTTLLLERAEGAPAGEQFHLPVDAVLRHAVRTERPRPAKAVETAPPAEPGSTIGPRDIQMRVRAGESPEALAQAHDVALDRIMRFALPVVQERSRIADEARRGRARRTTTDGQVVVFGEAVDERFAAHGIDPGDVEWDALRPDGEWLVVARWIGGLDAGEEHSAEWVFHRASRTVTPVDDSAIDLLSDRPIRPVVAPEPAAPTPPRLAPGVFVFPPMPDATTGPLPRIEQVFDQEAPSDGPVELPPLKTTPVDDAPTEPTLDTEPRDTEPRDTEPLDPQQLEAPAGETTRGETTRGETTRGETTRGETTRGETTVDFDEPPLPLGAWTTVPDSDQTLAEKIRRNKTGRRRESGSTRTKVPSWDDILLGVRRESD